MSATRTLGRDIWCGTAPPTVNSGALAGCHEIVLTARAFRRSTWDGTAPPAIDCLLLVTPNEIMSASRAFGWLTRNCSTPPAIDRGHLATPLSRSCKLFGQAHRRETDTSGGRPVFPNCAVLFIGLTTQLTDGGPPGVFEFSSDAAGPPFGAAPCSVFFGCGK